MDTYYDMVVDAANKSRNHMIAAASTAVVLAIVMYFTQSLWVALPVLATAIWYRSHEEAYKHYKSLKKGLDYEARKAAEMEQR